MALNTSTASRGGKPQPSNGRASAAKPTPATKPTPANAAGASADHGNKGKKRPRTPEQIAAAAERRTYSARRALLAINGLTAPATKSKRAGFENALTPEGRLYGVNWVKMGAPEIGALLTEFQAKATAVLTPIAETQSKNTGSSAPQLAVGDFVFVRPDSLKFCPGAVASAKYEILAMYTVPQGKGVSLSARVLSDTGDKDTIPARYLMKAAADGSAPAQPPAGAASDSDDDEDDEEGDDD